MNPFNYNRMHAYAKHRAKWSKCTRCEISCRVKSFFRANGNRCDYLFVGEAPGPSESVVGRPMVGQSGKLLDTLLAEVEMKNYVITNVIACYPKGDENGFRLPSKQEIANCKERLDEFVEIVRPRWYISLGKVAKANPPTGTSYHLELDHPSFIVRSGGVDSLVYRRNKHKLISFMEKTGDGKPAEKILKPI